MSKRVVVLYPFYSQQNKETGKFLFRSCGSTKMLRFIGEQLLRDGLTEKIRFAAPDSRLWGDDLSSVVPIEWIVECEIPPNNRLQRLTWPVRYWDPIFNGADLVFNMHELIGWPLKNLYPATRVISMFTVAPTGEPWPWMTPLINLGLLHSDLVTVPSEVMARYVKSKTRDSGSMVVPSTWPLSFDREQLDYLLSLPPSGRRPMDFLFVFRASASNYTHHREFVQALRLIKKPRRIAFTDTTRYLRENPRELDGLSLHDVEILDDPGDQRQYVDLLRRSHIVVGMNDNMHGGMGVREAMYTGAVPVLLDAPCYRELLPSGWPVWIPNPVTAEGIATALSRMLILSRGESDFAPKFLQTRAVRESFQETWKVMKPQIEGLLEKGG